MRDWTRVAAGALLVGAAVAAGCGSAPARPDAPRQAPVSLRAAPAGRAAADANWARIGERARAFVAAETPAAALPFQPARSGSEGPVVVAHYFPPYPLRIGNGPRPGGDYYRDQYLRPEGENGKFAAVGGLLRDRPLPGPARGDANLDMAIEVARAARIGIDAMGIDVMQINEGREWTKALRLLDAAQAVGGVRVIPEPDMTALRGVGVRELAQALGVFARHPAAYRLADGRLLVMPFAAEAQPPTFWRELIARMSVTGERIALMPVFVDSKTATSFAPFSVGQGVWGGRDPRSGEASVAYARQIRARGPLSYCAPVAAQDSRPKNAQFIEARNSEALRASWTAAIETSAECAHLLTWNDYSETTQFAPSAVTQFGVYDLSAYYIAWMKAGRPPAITRDALYLVHRRQILDPATPGLGRALRRRGLTPTSNDVELVALLTRPGRLVIEMGGQRVSRDVGAGLQTLRIPAAPGRPAAALLRGGRVIVEHDSPWTIEARPTRHDATYAYSGSTRPFVAVD